MIYEFKLKIKSEHDYDKVFDILENTFQFIDKLDNKLNFIELIWNKSIPDKSKTVYGSFNYFKASNILLEKSDIIHRASDLLTVFRYIDDAFKCTRDYCIGFDMKPVELKTFISYIKSYVNRLNEFLGEKDDNE